MKKLLPLIICFLPVLLCGCSGSDNADEEIITNSFTAPAKPASPVITPTPEEKAENTASLLKSAQDSFNRMNEAAQDKTATKEGIKAAEAVCEKYKSRLEELAETDFSSCSDEELTDLMKEISNIITAIREARDLINNI